MTTRWRSASLIIFSARHWKLQTGGVHYPARSGLTLIHLTSPFPQQKEGDLCPLHVFARRRSGIHSRHVSANRTRAGRPTGHITQTSHPAGPGGF
jgi:hypothetical protein